MKIGENDRLRGVAALSRTAPARRAEAQARAPAAAVDDTATVLGIPEHELTPKVRQAIFTLMAEVDRLRRELETNKSRIAYLERLADQDSLVPAINRRAFVRELSRMISFAERYGTPSSLLYFDINNMKVINDRYGHAAGDAALTHVAQTLVDQVRESDMVGRLGGDEFGVILANADEAAAMEKGAILVAAIEAGGIEWQGKRIPIGAAFGAYTFHGGHEASEVLNAADRDMYGRKNRDKKGG
ncbi:MAG: GGDEF domain-containing protein [Alphaproteobacteria bacterium]|nr:GGDEF domain-containing protein [Alphaproteobacteria bacterium]